MEERLDRNKKYNIENSSDKELLEVIEWLRKNDRGWEYINLSDFEGEKTLYFDGEEWVTSLELMDGAVDLFQELSRWYKYDDGSLFYVTSECKKGHLYGYGFNSVGFWEYNIDEGGDKCAFNSVAKNYKTPATKEEVEERLKQEAIKRGFVKGVRVGCLSDKTYSCKISNDDYYLNKLGDDILWNEFAVDTALIMKDGVWLEIETHKEAPTLVGDNQVVIEHTKAHEKLGEILRQEISRQPTIKEVSSIFNAREEKQSLKLKKTLKYLLKKDIILTPKQYKKLWKKN